MESIKHKFIETKFNEEFQTHNGVLDKTPYKPEVMIIGTFNPNTPNSNFADFFYGRNYFWPALKNLSENKIAYFKSRMPKRGIIKEPLNPTIVSKGKYSVINGKIIEEGRTATNPETGQKVVFKGGEWQNQ